MGQSSSRQVNRAVDHKYRQSLDRRFIRAIGKQLAGLVMLIPGLLSAFAVSLTAAAPAAGQDTPAKTDTAAANTAPPHDVAPKAPGQEPSSAQALSLHYRFLERYSTTEDANHPELIARYRVGMFETEKVVAEKPQAAPDRSQTTRATVYTEQAAQVTKMGELTSAVRRYDKFRDDLTKNVRGLKTPFFEGLTILYAMQPNHRPFLVNLTDGRPIRDVEYSELCKQVFLPRLIGLLPPTPKLVGDTWPIPTKSARYLVGQLPSPQGYSMSGTLLEVRKAGPGSKLTAVIRITGDFDVSFGPSSLNAELLFTFDPVAPVQVTTNSGATPKPGGASATPAGRRLGEGTVNAHGYISGLRMAWIAASQIPSDEARLKVTRTYELKLERRLDTAAGDGANANPPLALPQPLPTATDANSWLLYVDPLERFHFMHPQNLTPARGDVQSLELVDLESGTGKDVLVFTFPPGVSQPQADREFREVKQFQHTVDNLWTKMKDVETIRGRAEWLPEADWGPLKVFRKEIGVVTGGEDPGKAGDRIYCDYYLVLSTKNECFQLQVMTMREDHVAFRTQSEGIIKSFHFGKWDPGAKPPANAQPAASPAPAATTPAASPTPPSN